MAKKHVVQLTGNKHGFGIDTENLSGKPLTDEQAHIVVTQYLAEVLDGFAASVGALARAIEKKNIP